MRARRGIRLASSPARPPGHPPISPGHARTHHTLGDKFTILSSDGPTAPKRLRRLRYGWPSAMSSVLSCETTLMRAWKERDERAALRDAGGLCSSVARLFRQRQRRPVSRTPHAENATHATHATHDRPPYESALRDGTQQRRYQRRGTPGACTGDADTVIDVDPPQGQTSGKTEDLHVCKVDQIAANRPRKQRCH